MASGIYRYDVLKTVRAFNGKEITLETVTLYNDYDETVAWQRFTDGEFGFGDSITMYVFVNVNGQDQLFRCYERTK